MIDSAVIIIIKIYLTIIPHHAPRINLFAFIAHIISSLPYHALPDLFRPLLSSPALPRLASPRRSGSLHAQPAMHCLTKHPPAIPLLFLPALPNHSAPRLYVPRLPCPIFPHHASPVLSCHATPCRPSPSHACPALPDRYQPAQSMPSPPRLPCPV